MNNLDFNNIDKEHLIVKIDTIKEDNIIKITYASNRVVNENYSLHNLNVYRLKMEEETKKVVTPFLNSINKKVQSIYLKKFMSILIGILGIYLLNNIDINIIMKIILNLLIIIGWLIHYLYNEILLNKLHSNIPLGLALEYYLDNLNFFKYYDTKEGEYAYILPIEDISNMNITREVLEKMKEDIKEYKIEGKNIDINTFALRYKPTNGKSMI